VALTVEQLRASEIAYRRTEEERVEAFFLCERRRRRRIPSAMREQLQNNSCERWKSRTGARRRSERATHMERAEALFPLRATTAAGFQT
jgi:hypothetical protein